MKMEPQHWDELPNFAPHEFDSPDCPGSHELMDYDFMHMLQKARIFAGRAFVITSGYRTPSYHRRLGAQGYPISKNSSHLIGHAADIQVQSATDRAYILAGLLDAGFERIGIGKTFIHVDNDELKRSPCIWLY